MDVLTVLRERCTVHDYSTDPLPEGALERALGVALAAPNHRMTEPWRFSLVGPATRHKLCEISIALKTGDAEKARPEVAEKVRRKMLNPAELVVVSRARGEDPAVEREDYAAIACAIQNLTLALWAEGVGSKWSTGAVTTHAESYAALGIAEEHEEIVGFVWAGMPAVKPSKTRRRKSLDEVVRRLP